MNPENLNPEVAEQVTRIQNNVADSYNAVSEMGGELPEEQNSDNLPSAVRSIPQGGGGAVDSFNGRTGAIMPQEGDYTPAMTGSAPADHNHDTRYFQRSETMSRDEIEERLAGLDTGGTKIHLGQPTDVTLTNLDEGVAIKWTDPEDVVISGTTLAQWAGTVVVRKAGSAPTSKSDGTIVLDSKTKNSHKTTALNDTGLTNGTTYYYGIFPYSNDGVYTYDKVSSIAPAAILPSAATGVAATNTDEGCSLSFTKPTDATSVKVVYKTGSAATDPTQGNAVTGTTSPLSITGLTNGTKYYITVFTQNAKRYRATTIEFTPQAIYPSKPTGVTVTNGVLAATIGYTKPTDASTIKIVYKAGSAPTSPTDGTAVSSTSSPTTISGLVDKTTYYFVVYAYNAKRYTASDPVSVTARAAEHYAFTISDNESVCKSKITYPAGVDNSAFTPAGLSGNTFSYGSWAEAFFIKKLRVVMLNFDGTEAYEINKNNYKQKAAGGTVGTEGNVMVAFPKIYFKIIDNGNGTATVHVSDVKLDADYKCYAHIGIDGQEKDWTYMAAYDPCKKDSKLRSLTGEAPSVSTTAQQEIDAAKANNTGTKVNWYTGVVSDRKMVELLLLLIGKNTHMQEQFGYGYANNNSSALASGTMDTAGLFSGETGGKAGVKVFGIEHFWGNVWNRIAGWINANGTQKIKLTHGTQDGSTVTGYNLTGDGYLTVNTLPSSGWINAMTFHKGGLFPKTLGGSETTGYADYCYTNNSQVNVAFCGGGWSDGTYAGAFYANLDSAASTSDTHVGGSLSYKQG